MLGSKCGKGGRDGKRRCVGFRAQVPPGGLMDRMAEYVHIYKCLSSVEHWGGCRAAAERERRKIMKGLRPGGDPVDESILRYFSLAPGVTID